MGRVGANNKNGGVVFDADDVAQQAFKDNQAHTKGVPISRIAKGWAALMEDKYAKLFRIAPEGLLFKTEKNRLSTGVFGGANENGSPVLYVIRILHSDPSDIEHMRFSHTIDPIEAPADTPIISFGYQQYVDEFEGQQTERAKAIHAKIVERRLMGVE